MIKIKHLSLSLFALLCILITPVFSQSFSNEYCSFDVPANMEIQEGLLSELGKTANPSEAEFRIVLQQKGLNEASDFSDLDFPLEPYNDYCRITISCNEGTGGLGDLNSEGLQQMDDMMHDMIASIYEIPEWNGVKKVTFKGYPAYVTDYIRGSVTTEGSDVHVYNMAVSTDSYDWNIIFAAREKNIDKWIPSFIEFGESFEFTEEKPITSNSYSTFNVKQFKIKGTDQSFYWYSSPTWTTEYTEGIRCESFYDEKDTADGYISINVMTMDLEDYATNKYGKLGFLMGMQQQTGYAMTEAFGNLGWTVKQNEVDFDNLTYTYRYSYSVLGYDVEGLMIYSFSGSTAIAFSSEWDADYPDAGSIVDAYVNNLI